MCLSTWTLELLFELHSVAQVVFAYRYWEK